MKSADFVKKIKNYAVLSFLIPLITINACLLLYKFMGSKTYQLWPNLNWVNSEHSYILKEYNEKIINRKTNTYTNCSKNIYQLSYTTIDNKIITTDKSSNEVDQLLQNLLDNKKVKSINFKHGNVLDKSCIKNYELDYYIFKNFKWLETLTIHAELNNKAGFARIKNPYRFGEVSISRTARYSPATWIFKPFIILSAFFLILYWVNNLNFFNSLKQNNILTEFSKKFYFIGLLSCVFLILHASFLGLDVDSKLFHKIRKLIIILFILFEMSAQIFLTINLFKLKDKLKKYINPIILKIKIYFVVVVFFVTTMSFIILIFYDPSSSFKHILEWNYFSFLLLYYFLSRLLWKSDS